MKFAKPSGQHMFNLAWAIVAIIVSLALPGVVNAGPLRERSVIGQWKLTAVLDFAEVSGLDDAEAAALVGEVMTISGKSVKLGSRTCSASGFNAERVEPYHDLREKAHASADKLGLPSPVTVVELSCAYVYLKSRDRIVLAYDGVFFDAVRINPWARSPAARGTASELHP